MALHLSTFIEDSEGRRRDRLRETLAGLASDSDRYARYFGIEGLNRFDDPRAVEAIVRELEGTDEELLLFYQFLLPSVLARPNSRYLPGIKRMNAKFPGAAGLDEALNACRVKRWFPWG